MYKDFYQSNRNYKKNFAKLIDIEYQQRKRQEEKVESEDTTLRKEIHVFIAKNATRTKSKEQLLSLLEEQFSDPKYEKYHQYFERWVSDAVRGDEER